MSCKLNNRLLGKMIQVSFLYLSDDEVLLCSAAGPHTIINGKEVVNFASANYLGLIGHQKLLVRK